jgi:hypothetical protein
MSCKANPWCCTVWSSWEFLYCGKRCVQASLRRFCENWLQSYILDGTGLQSNKTQSLQTRQTNRKVCNRTMGLKVKAYALKSTWKQSCSLLGLRKRLSDSRLHTLYHSSRGQQRAGYKSSYNISQLHCNSFRDYRKKSFSVFTKDYEHAPTAWKRLIYND